MTHTFTATDRQWSRRIDDTEAFRAREAWWKSAVVYQVYPRSFQDSDGNGIGDLPGVLSRIDYLADLGVDAVWLSPVYQSPQVDNGYDVSDYQAIDPIFGTLDDLDALIAALHERGMKIVMDLVVNHTSSQHPWFVKSRSSRDDAKSDWYFWRDARPGTVPGEPGSEPNNWGSAFSGSAWEWDTGRQQYYLHLFAVTQPDLNWDNPQVREAIFAMMNWWCDRGVDGFRMDVINFISKDPGLPDGPVTATGYGDGMPHYSHGPQIHAYLDEMNRKVFDGRPESYLLVGEMPGVTPAQAKRFTDLDEGGEVDMVFGFDHMGVDQGSDKWTPRPVDVGALKRVLSLWQDGLGEGGWNSLYWSNHDQPRVVSRYGNDTKYWRESATALAAVLHLQRGTPYVYQGEELGMTNVHFDTIADFRDVESLHYYEAAVSDHGQTPAAVLERLRHGSRDNARTPMQWSTARGGGFSDGTAWIPMNPNHSWLNAAQQVADPDSIHHFYRALIQFRHSHRVVVDGRFELIVTVAEDTYAFRRQLGEDWIEVVANLSDDEASWEKGLRGPSGSEGQGSLLLANYVDAPTSPTPGTTLRPWEVRVHGSV